MNAPATPKPSMVVDTAAIQPLPNSRKIHVAGKWPDIRVPMREISQSDTPTQFGGEANPPITVYDTSGPYTDPAARIDIQSGLAPLRAGWIAERGDCEQLAGLSSEYGRAREADPKLAELRFNLTRQPRRALPGRNVSQMHYARRGIVTPEMEFVAIRESLRRREYLDSLRRRQEQQAGGTDDAPASGPGLRRGAAGGDHAGIRARRDRRRPRHPAGQHQSPRIRAHDHRPQFPGQNQRKHRQ